MRPTSSIGAAVERHRLAEVARRTGIPVHTTATTVTARCPLPSHGHPDRNPSDPNAGQLAVINLRGSFISRHPSGILAEDLTLQSIIGTLHAALPQIVRIRFLVDGNPHDTLAGHADLQHTYPATDTATKPTQPTEEATRP